MPNTERRPWARRCAAAMLTLALLAASGGVQASRTRDRNLSRGEFLFSTRCSACHCIGREPAGAQCRQTVGPNLLDVSQRRERGWLERWLREPDQVLAEKDPLAMAMLAQFDNVRMPNLRLTEDEARALLDFIDGESRRKSRHHAPGRLLQEVSQ